MEAAETLQARRSRPAQVTPVIEALDIDIDPLEAFVRLSAGAASKAGAKSFLFESAEKGGKSAKYSFIGSGSQSIVIRDGRITCGGRDVGPYPGGPVAYLKAFMAGYRPQPPVFFREESFSREAPPLPPFFGGLAGYISYDFVRYVDPIIGDMMDPIGDMMDPIGDMMDPIGDMMDPIIGDMMDPIIGDTATDDVGCDDADLLFVEDLVVFDHAAGHKLLIANASSTGRDSILEARGRLKAMKQTLSKPVQRPAAPRGNGIKVRYPTPKEQYMDMVSRSKEYILDGDAFQIVLSMRAEVEAEVDHVELYRTLKEINPSPYMYFLEFGDTAIVGSSPEILSKVVGRQVIVRPIAGTRRRGRSDEEDKALEAEMKADPKEVAEHVMLVDLGRNDVGKVSKFGSVRVDDFMGVEKYSHVMHIVSNVVGDLEDDKDAIDVLAATFPAGTVSGAPKTRAMQIIEELEGSRRGLYAGCVGYFCFNGNMDTAIAIRTILLKNGKAYVQAGAGIVMDSVPENEYNESMSKGAAMIKALEIACNNGGREQE
jgi:anthranilate synthase component 1